MGLGLAAGLTLVSQVGPSGAGGGGQSGEVGTEELKGSSGHRGAAWAPGVLDWGPPLEAVWPCPDRRSRPKGPVPAVEVCPSKPRCPGRLRGLEQRLVQADHRAGKGE